MSTLSKIYGKISLVTLIATATLLVAACASAPSEQMSLEEKLAERNYAMRGEIDRIQDYRIDGWYYVDDYNVIFRGGPSDYYLLTFNQRCLNLRGAHTIGFSTTVGRVTRFDEVLVRDQSGMPPERCLISEMHRLEKLS